MSTQKWVYSCPVLLPRISILCSSLQMTLWYVVMGVGRSVRFNMSWLCGEVGTDPLFLSPVRSCRPWTSTLLMYTYSRWVSTTRPPRPRLSHGGLSHYRGLWFVRWDMLDDLTPQSSGRMMRVTQVPEVRPFSLPFPKMSRQPLAQVRNTTLWRYEWGPTATPRTPALLYPQLVYKWRDRQETP